jgi:hypothetical protein
MYDQCPVCGLPFHRAGACQPEAAVPEFSGQRTHRVIRIDRQTIEFEIPAKPAQ